MPATFPSESEVYDAIRVQHVNDLLQPVNTRFDDDNEMIDRAYLTLLAWYKSTNGLWPVVEIVYVDGESKGWGENGWKGPEGLRIEKANEPLIQLWKERPGVPKQVLKISLGKARRWAGSSERATVHFKRNPNNGSWKVCYRRKYNEVKLSLPTLS